MPMSLAEKVEDFLAQERIAVAGVSRDGKATGNAICRRLRERGFQVVAVNPNADEIDGEVCYRSVKAIPGKVGGVIIVTRPNDTEQVVRDCDEAGIRRVWMHEGIHSASSVSQSAVDYCRQHNISVIAGVCPMMFGKTSDGFHRFFKLWSQITGHLPE